MKLTLLAASDVRPESEYIFLNVQTGRLWYYDMFKDQKLFSTLALRHMIHSGPTGTMNCFHGLKAGSYSHLKADTRVSFTA